MENYHHRAKKLTILDKEIGRFDCILEELQEHLTDDLDVYESVVSARDVLYDLKAKMRNCVITRFNRAEVAK